MFDARGCLDPARGPRFLLRVGGAARRPLASGASRHRGRGRGAGRELRGQGVRCPRPDGRRRPAGCARTRCGVPAVRRLLGREQGRLRGLRQHLAAGRGDLDRRGVPRRGGAAADRRAGRSRSPGSSVRTCATRSGWPSPSASRAPSSSRRSPVGSASPMASSWSSPIASSSSCTPFRSSACGAWARSRRRRCGGGASRRSARSRCSTKGPWWPCSARGRAATSTRWPTTATHGPCRRVAGVGRSVPSAPSAGARRRPTTSTPRSWRSSTA